MASTYNPNIPTGFVDLDEDYLNIQKNFTQANTTMGINHFPFDDQTASNGKHKCVQMPSGSLPLGLVTGENTLYSKSAGGAAQVFVTNGNTGNEYQLTNIRSTGDFARFSTTPNGWTFLPGGLIMQYGIKSIAASSTPTTVLFVTANIDFPTECIAVFLTGINDQGNSPSANSSFVKDGSVSKTGFTITNSSSSSSQKVYWWAIGY